MKKRILLLVLLLATFAACRNVPKMTEDTSIDEVERHETSSDSTSNIKVEAPVRYEQLPITIRLVDRWSNGKPSPIAVLTNNSDYIVTYFHLEALLKDLNEKVSFTTNNPTAPGESSPNFGGSVNFEIETDQLVYLRSRYHIMNGTAYYDIDYDHKTESYSVNDTTEREKSLESSTPTVPYTDFTFQSHIVKDINSDEDIVVTTYTNNSRYPSTRFEFNVLNKETNEIDFLSSYDTVMPGETSPNFAHRPVGTTPPESLNVLSILYTVSGPNSNDIMAEYNLKTSRYTRIYEPNP